jgi:cobalt-zinc-cadmium efflux system outer membrane protein
VKISCLTAETAIGLALAAALAGAQTPAAPPANEPAPTVESLVVQALERAPSIAALEARLAAAREMVGPAGALPDPMVDVALQDIGFPKWTVGTEQMSMIGPGIQQDLPYPGKRDARRDAAGAEAAVRAADLEELRRELASKVRVLYARIYALDRESQDLAAAREMLDMLSATVAGRYSVGETDEEPVLKVQLEGSRLAERTEDLVAERAGLVAALNRILDRPGAAPLGPVLELPNPGVPPMPWEDLAVSASPDVAARQAAVTAAEKRVALARLDFKPDFTTGAALGLRGGFDPAVILRFGLVIPLWRKEKQEPLLHASEDELARAKAELADAEASARSEAARLAAAWLRAGRQIDLYRQAIVPQSSAAVDAARAAYLVGRGDFLTVVDDFNRWLDARVRLARREADRFAVWAELQALTGERTDKES